MIWIIAYITYELICFLAPRWLRYGVFKQLPTGQTYSPSKSGCKLTLLFFLLAPGKLDQSTVSTLFTMFPSQLSQIIHLRKHACLILVRNKCRMESNYTDQNAVIWIDTLHSLNLDSFWLETLQNICALYRWKTNVWWRANKQTKCDKLNRHVSFFTFRNFY